MDGTQACLNNFFCAKEQWVLNEEIPINSWEQEFFIMIQYNGNQKVYLDKTGNIQKEKCWVSLGNIRRIPLEAETQTQSAYLFTRRNYTEIMNEIDSVASLGFREIHLPPVFSSFSSHGYDWITFSEIDINFCTKEQYQKAN